MSGESSIPTNPIENNAIGEKRDSRDKRGRFLKGAPPIPGTYRIKKGEVLNPAGSMSPAIHAAVETLNTVGKAMREPAVQERIRAYIATKATEPELIALALKITDREDRTARIQAAGELVGLTLGQLVAAIKANPARDAAELAKVIEADAEVRDIAPP